MPNWKLVWWKTTEQLLLCSLYNFSSVQQLTNRKLSKGFPVLHVAFSPTHSRADDFPLQYRMFSQEFLTDLLGPFEITASLSELITITQAVHYFHWKIVLDNIREFLHFKKHLADTQKLKFQGVKVFDDCELLDRGDYPRVVYNFKERSMD